VAVGSKMAAIATLRTFSRLRISDLLYFVEHVLATSNSTAASGF